MGVITGDTRSLDYSSCGSKSWIVDGAAVTMLSIVAQNGAN